MRRITIILIFLLAFMVVGQFITIDLSIIYLSIIFSILYLISLVEVIRGKKLGAILAIILSLISLAFESVCGKIICLVSIISDIAILVLAALELTD